MNSIHQHSNETIKNHVAESDSMAAAKGDASASDGLARLSKVIVGTCSEFDSAMEALRALSDLLIFAEDQPSSNFMYRPEVTGVLIRSMANEIDGTLSELRECVQRILIGSSHG